MGAHIRVHVKLINQQPVLMDRLLAGATAEDKVMRDLKGEFWEAFAADPFLRQFTRKEFRLEMGHRSPVQLHLKRPEFSSTDGLQPDTRLHGYDDRIARITGRFFFSLPPSVTALETFAHYAYQQVYMFLSWEGGGRGDSYRVDFEAPARPFLVSHLEIWMALLALSRGKLSPMYK